MAENHDIITNYPSQFLIDHVGMLPRGRVLDIAMGSGRNSVYLAERGFWVEGVDISEESIKQAEKLAAEHKVSIQTQLADLEKDYHISPDAYDVIICFNYLQRSLMPQIKAGLKYGGLIVYETFIVDQTEFGKPRNPDYLLQHNELLHLFSDFRCLYYREGIIDNRKAVASLIARKI